MHSADRTPEHRPETSEALLRRLEWTALRRLDGLLQGDFSTLLRGGGLDLADLREYAPGDDVRYIDWNVTARTGTPHVRVFTEDREMTVWLLLDLSASMGAGSAIRTKHAVLREFCGLVARIFTRHGNRVGAMLGSRRDPRWLPARTGRAHVLQLLQETSQLKAGAERPGKTPKQDDSPLQHWLESAARILKRRATVLVASDFLAQGDWERPLGQLAQKHDVVAVRLVDPLERGLPDIGLVTMQDAETGEQMWVDTHDRAFRRRFAQAAAARETALRSRFARAGVDTLELCTTDDLAEAMTRFSRMRKRRTDGAGRSAYRQQRRDHLPAALANA